VIQVLAAGAELAMPHFISAAIFAVAKNGVGEQLYFERSLHILAVGSHFVPAIGI
jgi:hypothetical protein